jgi:hypothetical protein
LDIRDSASRVWNDDLDATLRVLPCSDVQGSWTEQPSYHDNEKVASIDIHDSSLSSMGVGDVSEAAQQAELGACDFIARSVERHVRRRVVYHLRCLYPGS